MTARAVTIPKKELAGYVEVMREAQVENWTVTAVRPDGTQIIITASALAPRGNAIDKMLGL